MKKKRHILQQEQLKKCIQQQTQQTKSSTWNKKHCVQCKEYLQIKQNEPCKKFKIQKVPSKTSMHSKLPNNKCTTSFRIAAHPNSVWSSKFASPKWKKNCCFKQMCLYYSQHEDTKIFSSVLNGHRHLKRYRYQSQKMVLQNPPSLLKLHFYLLVAFLLGYASEVKIMNESQLIGMF